MKNDLPFEFAWVPCEPLVLVRNANIQKPMQPPPPVKPSAAQQKQSDRHFSREFNIFAQISGERKFLSTGNGEEIRDRIQLLKTFTRRLCIYTKTN